MKKSLVLLLLLAACSKTELPVARKNATRVNPASAVVAPAAASPSVTPSSSLLTGTIAETMNAGGYTYIKVKTAAGGQWAAVPEAPVRKGDNITIAAQMTMEKFESRSLDRRFETIVFGSIAGPASPAPAGVPAMQAQMPPGHPPQGAERAVGKLPPQMVSALAAIAPRHMEAPDVDVKVDKPAGGKSVVEVWAEKSALNGNEVVVRGKVVKFLGGIMGTNWMHLQDGTGSKEKGDNDLTVTTNAKVKVGDVVTIRGTLAADKDFGAGYRYAVIVEKATVTP